MGYLSSRQTKAQLVDRIKYDNMTIKDWSLVGNHLWGLYPHEGKLLIHLFLLQPCGDFEWGFKVIGEQAHPYYYTCPLKFLKKAEVLSQEWRDNVMEYHANKPKRTSIKFNVGDVIRLVNCNVKQVEITSVKPLLGMDISSGIIYSIPKKYIA